MILNRKHQEEKDEDLLYNIFYLILANGGNCVFVGLLVLIYNRIEEKLKEINEFIFEWLYILINHTEYLGIGGNCLLKGF